MTSLGPVVLILARREYGSSVNTFITNQSAMDLFTSASTVIIYVTMLSRGFEYSGNHVADNIFCIVVEGAVFSAAGVVANKTGLVVLTLERSGNLRVSLKFSQDRPLLRLL